jgi:4-hydroxymandelate oxidase
VTTFVNLLELEALANPHLPTAVFDYFAGGAHDEITLGANRGAYDAIALRPRILVDVSRRDLSTTLLGQTLALPVLVAPMALQRMAHTDGELATARAATSVKTVFTVSTLSSVSVEDIRPACGLAPWFQIYVHQDRSLTEAMLARVSACGYGALVLTVDTPVLGRRERDVRNTFQPPPGVAFANMMAGKEGSHDGHVRARFRARDVLRGASRRERHVERPRLVAPRVSDAACPQGRDARR